jgi:hypothetical protein
MGARARGGEMMMRKILWVLLVLAVPGLATAAAEPHKMPVKPVERLADRPAVTKHLRAMGYRARGGVDKDTTDRDERDGRSFPHFTSSFTVGGKTYPFTMVGYKPQSGRASTIRTVIIPLRMNFSYFGPNQDVSRSFEPAAAVANIIGSPLYKNARYPNGVGQFGDQMQRAAFWNRMDPGRSWHVYMDSPTVAPTVDIEVTPETGSLQDAGGGVFFGDVLIDFLDSQAQTILQFMDLPADVLPIFVTSMVTAEALGYHTAYAVPKDNGNGTRLQTFIFTSWLDPAAVDPLFADVSTFNHELSEWLNDPFTNNAVPDWVYPPASDGRAVCSGNPLLEVGDPQGNGPTYDDFPTALVAIGGVTYHLQQLVLWQWFADEVPSSAYGGWYTFPIPKSITQPAVNCP